MATVNVRYMVHDVETAVVWYTKYLGFTLLSKQSQHSRASCEDRLAIAQRAEQLCRATDARQSR